MEDLARRFAHFHGNIPQFVHGFLVRQKQVDEIKTNFNILILLSSSSIDKFFEIDIIFENTIDIDFFSNMYTFEIWHFFENMVNFESIIENSVISKKYEVNVRYDKKDLVT